MGSPLDLWTRVTEVFDEGFPPPANMFGAITFREWCERQVSWMQEKNISARLAFVGGTSECFIETKRRK